MKASVRGLAIASWKDADLDLDSECSLDGIEFRRVHLTWSGQELDINGRIGGPAANPALDLQGTIASESVAAALDSVGVKNFGDARASGKIRVAGSVHAPQVETTVDLLELTALGMRFSKTTIDAVLARWRAPGIPLHSLDEPTIGPSRPSRRERLVGPRRRIPVRSGGTEPPPGTGLAPDVRMEGAFTLEARAPEHSRARRSPPR